MISLTTYWTHTYYANYKGTVDYKGNDITPVPEYNAPMVTRGGQDAYSGYGSDWSKIRTMPNEFAASCLAANDKAYFNFEHEESIGQPNWELCKGKPWYLVQSYEWDYDKGSIGRRLTTAEWKASQGWQAFSAWESMKKQVLLGYDGFSWCCLHGGPNMGTYKKPLIDDLGHPKISWYVNRMIFQKIWAGSDNTDVVYGPGDKIVPVIHNLGEKHTVRLDIYLETGEGRPAGRKSFKDLHLEAGNTLKYLDGFTFGRVRPGTYAVRYVVTVTD